MGKNKGRREGHERFQIGGRNASGEDGERAVLSSFYATLSLEKAQSGEPSRHQLSHAGRNS